MCTFYSVVLLFMLLFSSINGSRQLLRFRCDDHRIIGSELVCDGQPDCPDGSDERETICEKVVCDEHYLKCDYGACVKDLSYCYNVRQQHSSKQQTSCFITNIPRNGFVKHLPNNYSRLGINDLIANFGQIEYTCIENHYTIGESMNFCYHGEWVNKVPECQPRCNPSIISSITFLASCYTKTNGYEMEVRCTDLAEPGTIARITCKWGYERINARIQVLTCDGDGRWSPLPVQCTQICGEEAAEGTAFIVGGVDADIKKVPWHVGIYQKNRRNSEFVQQCGGSIISPKVIVSAAHCFWNRIENRLNPESEYRVVVGKYYRDLNDPRETNAYQALGVDKVHLVNGYIDYEGLFANDVAVVILNSYIEYKLNVAPICMEEYKFDEKIVPAGSVGLVAGWGLVESAGAPSPTLKQIHLPVVQREQCLQIFDQHFRPFFTSDKFCAGHLSGVGVCMGDSGGGLAFPKKINDRKVYFLRGIVSNGQSKAGSCDNDKYALFTNTAHFWDLIEHHEIANRPESWMPQPPTKLEPIARASCPPIREDSFVLSNCTTNNKNNVCSLTKEIGSTVITTCMKGYHTRIPILHKCLPKGVWSPPITKCNAICGRTPSLPFIPWLISIYIPKDNILPLVGSGIIVSERVVLTYANDSSDIFTSDINTIQIYAAVLHYFDNDNTDNQQFRKVAERFLVPNPIDDSDRTLAVLIMNNRFNFNLNFVAPICLDFSVNLLSFNNDGETGKISAYSAINGRIEENFYKILKNSECNPGDDNINRELLRGKMCARRPQYVVGTNCTMVEGTGLVFPKTQNGENVYYLKGIAMKGFLHPQYLLCVDDEFQLFHNINYFKDSIQKYIVEFEKGTFRK